MKHAESSTVLDAIHSTTDLTELIRQRAHLEGFDKVGIVRWAVLEEEGAHLKEWLSRNFHGDMMCLTSRQ